MAQRTPTLLADVALIGVALMWGGSYLAAQVMTQVASPVAVLGLRFLPSVAVLALAAAIRRTVFTRRMVMVGLVLGAWQAATLALETTAVTLTSSSNAGVLVCLAVVIAPALEGLVTGNRLPRLYYVAAALGLLGVLLLIGPAGLTAPSPGDLLVLGAACTRACLMVTSGRLGSGADFDAVGLNVVQSALNALLFGALGATQLPRVVTSLDAGHVAVWAFLSLGCTCAAFLLQLWAIQQTSATRASLLMGTEPVWALLAGILLAGDRLGVLSTVGAALIIASTLWGQRIEARWRARLVPVTPSV